MNIEYNNENIDGVELSGEEVYVSVRPNGGCRKVYVGNGGGEYVRWSNNWRKICGTFRINKRGQRVVNLERL